MKQLLAFPKKYEVTGKITKDRFLNSGNLTDAEKKVLELYLKNINILYDIRFLDQSEMIVLEIELTDAERGKYGLSNLVKAIAQSIPYLCMLLVRTEGVIRFFTFDRKENEFDDSRSRVRDICSSQDIIPIKEDISDGILITKLRASIANATSAEELNIEWSKLLKDCGLVLDTFDVSIDEYHHLENSVTLNFIFQKIFLLLIIICISGYKYDEYLIWKNSEPNWHEKVICAYGLHK